ncbi:MAG TPA: SPFH domain-containing protein, partial [Alphaproteobacteria bacterium]|nr:SPFH domain-containing protein [Alphaproteobacteria bacterium]
MNNDRENEGLKKTWPARAAKWSGYTLAGILGASTIIDGILVTPESQRKVITTGGQFSRIQGPGFGLKIPFLQGSTSLPIKMVELHTKPTNTATQDNQT